MKNALHFFFVGIKVLGSVFEKDSKGVFDAIRV
jgi:hypothetical protein